MIYQDTNKCRAQEWSMKVTIPPKDQQGVAQDFKETSVQNEKGSMENGQPFHLASWMFWDSSPMGGSIESLTL